MLFGGSLAYWIPRELKLLQRVDESAAPLIAHRLERLVARPHMHRFWFPSADDVFVLQDMTLRALLGRSPVEMERAPQDDIGRSHLPETALAFFGSAKSWWQPGWVLLRDSMLLLFGSRSSVDVDDGLREIFLNHTGRLAASMVQPSLVIDLVGELVGDAEDERRLATGALLRLLHGLRSRLQSSVNVDALKRVEEVWERIVKLQLFRNDDFGPLRELCYATGAALATNILAGPVEKFRMLCSRADLEGRDWRCDVLQDFVSGLCDHEGVFVATTVLRETLYDVGLHR
jgi:hypothetical protein